MESVGLESSKIPFFKFGDKKHSMIDDDIDNVDIDIFDIDEEMDMSEIEANEQQERLYDHLYSVNTTSINIKCFYVNEKNELLDTQHYTYGLRSENILQPEEFIYLIKRGFYLRYDRDDPRIKRIRFQDAYMYLLVGSTEEIMKKIDEYDYDSCFCKNSGFLHTTSVGPCISFLQDVNRIYLFFSETTTSVANQKMHNRTIKKVQYTPELKRTRRNLR